MIRVRRVSAVPNPVVLPEMDLAHRFCRGRGIELGAAAHNPFQLPGARNVAPYSDAPEHPARRDYESFKQAQVEFCGAHALVDVGVDGEELPLPDASEDYVLSSHVVEHLGDPLGAFRQWTRVLRPNGVILMLFPRRDADPDDVGRPLTSLSAFVDAHEGREQLPTDREHRSVFSLFSMLGLIALANERYRLGWRVLAVEARDSKVGNGHTVLARVVRSPPP